MSPAEQARANLRLANEVRSAAALQRKALAGAPVRAVVSAIVSPSRELAAVKLATLIAPEHGLGLIPKVREVRLGDALAELQARRPHGRRWHPALRLRDLSKSERRLLARALVSRAPRAWREASPSQPTNERNST